MCKYNGLTNTGAGSHRVKLLKSNPVENAKRLLHTHRIYNSPFSQFKAI